MKTESGLDENGEKALRRFLAAALLFAARGEHPRNDRRGSRFHEFAEATVAASEALGLHDSRFLAMEFEAIKKQVTYDGGRIDRQAFDMKLLDAAHPFFEVFSRPGCSYGQLFAMAKKEKLFVDDLRHAQRRKQLFANIKTLRDAYRFHSP